MKQSKAMNVLPFLFLGLIFLLPLLGLINQIAAFADPAGHNYRIEYLSAGEAVDAYLYTGENIIAIIALSCLAVYLIAFIVMKALRKNVTFIEMILIGNALFLAFSLTRAIYCFCIGSTSIPVGVFYVVAALGSGFMMYEFPKRAADGDCLTPYFVGAIITIGAFLFGSATSHSYSLLNAYGHIGDVVYWSGYLATRAFALTFGFLVFGNLNFNCDPSIVLAEYEASK